MKIQYSILVLIFSVGKTLLLKSIVSFDQHQQIKNPKKIITSYNRSIIDGYHLKKKKKKKNHTAALPTH